MGQAFAAERYELAVAGKPGGSLLLEPLDPANAGPLAHGFAAIDPWRRYPYPPAKLAGYLAATEPGAPRFQLVLDGALAGAVGVRVGWLRGPYVQFLGVLPAFQGAGLGSVVLAWVEQQARDAEERNVWVAASDFNDSAIRFYERHGFVAVARLDGLVRDDRAEVLLRKRL